MDRETLEQMVIRFVRYNLTDIEDYELDRELRPLELANMHGKATFPVKIGDDYLIGIVRDGGNEYVVLADDNDEEDDDDASRRLTRGWILRKADPRSVQEIEQPEETPPSRTSTLLVFLEYIQKAAPFALFGMLIILSILYLFLSEE